MQTVNPAMKSKCQNTAVDPGLRPRERQGPTLHHPLCTVHVAATDYSTELNQFRTRSERAADVKIEKKS